MKVEGGGRGKGGEEGEREMREKGGERRGRREGEREKREGRKGRGEEGGGRGERRKGKESGNGCRNVSNIIHNGNSSVPPLPSMSSASPPPSSIPGSRTVSK